MSEHIKSSAEELKQVEGVVNDLLENPELIEPIRRAIDNLKAKKASEQKEILYKQVVTKLMTIATRQPEYVSILDYDAHKYNKADREYEMDSALAEDLNTLLKQEKLLYDNDNFALRSNRVMTLKDGKGNVNYKFYFYEDDHGAISNQMIRSGQERP